MTHNYLIVTDSPFPDWDSALDGDLTYVDKVFDPDEWARIIFEHYKNADALITDFAPNWPGLTNSSAINSFNGLNALLGAKENALPSFVYTPFLSEFLVCNSYRAACNAVVHSYSHSLDDLNGIINKSISNDKSDRIWIDTDNLPLELCNQVIATTDGQLSCLSDTEIKMFNLFITTDNYEIAAEVSGYKAGYLRNKGSMIFQKCGFKTRSQALAHASRIGIRGFH